MKMLKCEYCGQLNKIGNDRCTFCGGGFTGEAQVVDISKKEITGGTLSEETIEGMKDDSDEEFKELTRSKREVVRSETGKSAVYIWMTVLGVAAAAFLVVSVIWRNKVDSGYNEMSEMLNTISAGSEFEDYNDNVVTGISVKIANERYAGTSIEVEVPENVDSIGRYKATLKRDEAGTVTGITFEDLNETVLE